MSRVEPFGVFAIRKGYATADDIHRGVQVQEQIAGKGGPPPLLGVVLLQMGVVTTEQMIEVLQEMEQARARTAGRT